MSSVGVPVADAGDGAALDRARVYTRARARLAGLVARVAADARGAWLATARPPSVGDWAAQVRVVPPSVQGSPLLATVWRVCAWLPGVLVAAVSVVLFAAAGGLRWVSCRPVRCVPALVVFAAAVAAYRM